MENALMAPRKHNKINRNPAAEAVAKAIIENYKPETVEDRQYRRRIIAMRLAFRGRG